MNTILKSLTELLRAATTLLGLVLVYFLLAEVGSIDTELIKELLDRSLDYFFGGEGVASD